MIRSVVFGVLLVTLAQSVPADDVRIPKVLVEGWKIELIDSEPNLVTPVSCRFDSKGNLFVVECHTHMPPENYAGPKVDHVYVYPSVYNNLEKDVAVNARVLFYEGSVKTMGLAVDAQGWVNIASRSEIIRVKDTNFDFKADVTEKLISHQTKADYPHNGLSGLALSSDGYLYFGQGENFGEKFTIVGTDDSKQQGSGEGGSVYRCRRDGSGVERIATGIWNPFGLAFDREKRLWCVDNDPDSRPPCRLLHIVPTADYGFQFRFGRAGTNPLLSWDGELPGTLPMSAGTGEAPCEVVEHLGHLLVSSWGDNRIERFSLTPNGASLKGQMDVIVQGDANFRPVSFAVAPDQSIFFTDWVDRSYPVHGKGRLWRLIPRYNGMHAVPEISEQEKLARKILDGKADAFELQKAVNTDDPFLQTAATIGKTLLSSSLTAKPWNGTSAIERSENLRILRWQSLTHSEASREFNRPMYLDEVAKSLKDEDLRVRLLAIRYAAESGEKSLVPELEKLISNSALDANEFHHLVSAISFLKSGSASGAKRDPARDQMLSSFFSDPTKPIELRKLALRQLPSNSKELDPSKLVQMLRDPKSTELRHDLLMYLAQRGSTDVTTALADILRSPEAESSLRADILAVLASLPSFQTKWNEATASELKKVDSYDEYKTELLRVTQMLDAQVLGKKSVLDQARPRREAIDQWATWIERTAGDANRGWRVWARSQCVKCHAMDGRGAELGPDLSTLGKSADRKRILQSMLDPSREVAPLFATWNILTVDGRVLTGAKLNAGGVGTNLQFLGADGKTFEVPLKEIESQQVSFKSIMPEDITDTLSVDEISDLLEFLSRSKR